MGEMNKMTKKTFRSIRHQKGQTLVEYALILAIISIIAIGVLIAVGGGIQTIFTHISSSLVSAQSSH